MAKQAREYVGKHCPPYKSLYLAAKAFDKKEFLPTFKSIECFCDYTGVPVPKARGRISSIPRVFRYLSTLKSKEIKKLMQYNEFTGPTRLGPIADAILNFRR